MLTLAKAAESLAVSERTVRRLVASGELRHVRIRGLVRIDRADLRRYITQRTSRAPRAESVPPRRKDYGALTPQPSAGLTEHDVLIEALCLAHGAERRRLRPRIKEAFQADGFPRLGVVPDAFRIELESRSLDVFEVELSSRLTTEKLNRYAELQVEFDFHEIVFRVFTVNRYGHINQIDLREYYRPLRR